MREARTVLADAACQPRTRSTERAVAHASGTHPTASALRDRRECAGPSRRASPARRHLPHGAGSTVDADRGRAVLLPCHVPASSGSRRFISHRSSGFRRVIASCPDAAACWSSRSPLFAVADASGPEIDQGSALRWLAESLWFPYALVSDAIEWESIDARSARATLRGDGLATQAVFEIDEEGKIAALHADRYRDVGTAARCWTRGAAGTVTMSSAPGFACRRRWRSHGICRAGRSAMHAFGSRRSSTTSRSRSKPADGARHGRGPRVPGHRSDRRRLGSRVANQRRGGPRQARASPLHQRAVSHRWPLDASRAWTPHSTAGCCEA